MERVTWKLTLPYVKQTATEICCMAQETQGLCINLEGCMAQETQTGALYQARRRWERVSKGKGYMYTYG